MGGDDALMIVPKALSFVLPSAEKAGVYGNDRRRRLHLQVRRLDVALLQDLQDLHGVEVA